MSDDFTDAVRTAAGTAWKGPTTPPPRADARWNAQLQCWMVPLSVIAAEREECAKIADQVRQANEGVEGTLASVQHECASHIAQEIRARGDSP